MKFALLGADDESLQLARAAANAGHSLVWHGDHGAVSDADGLAGEDAAEQWEALLDDHAADAIFVGRGAADPDLRARQVQELARQGRPMLLVHPIVPNVLSFFEIDMARGEGGCLVQHYNPLVESAAAEEAAGWAADGHPELGPVEQIVAVRFLDDRSRENVERRLARDLQLLDRCAGRLDRIGAHAAAGDQTAYAALSVQLLGPGSVPVRWTVEPPTRAESLQLMFVCQRGRATLVFDAADTATELILTAGGQESVTILPVSEPALTAANRFIAALENQGDGSAAASTWPTALHAMELVDSIEISLRRGRMIDVHAQQLTEHMAFKGTMAAASCGVLMIVVPMLLVAGWIAGHLGVPVARYWPHVLLALLAVFLGLQLLPKLLYGRSGGESTER